MTYAETLAYLYSSLPVFHRDGPAAYKANLDNTLALLAALGNPERRFRSVHVAGTNGKGSVSSMLASVLMAAGYGKVGLYTSPHLKNFTERIRISGREIPEDYVVEFVKQVQPLIEEIAPSFFELTVALCFHYFAHQQVDVAVIEVGLGGRLDSTNVIVPDLSVITNIGWDHMDLLGDTLEKIATEKAGIIKAGIPVVVGEWLPETRSVFEKRAAEVGASLTFSQSMYSATQLEWGLEQQRFSLIHLPSGEVQEMACDLLGSYQSNNVRTVIAAVDGLNAAGYHIDRQALHKGLHAVRRSTGLRGRMEILQTEPLVLADVAHNADGLTAVLQQVHGLVKYGLHIVFGMVKDKDVSKVLALLPPAGQYYFVQADSPRAMTASELSAHARVYGLLGRHYVTVQDGLSAALSAANPNDVVLVTGSIFVVAEVI